jgi:hypothetical protein
VRSVVGVVTAAVTMTASGDSGQRTAHCGSRRRLVSAGDGCLLAVSGRASFGRCCGLAEGPGAGRVTRRRQLWVDVEERKRSWQQRESEG